MIKSNKIYNIDAVDLLKLIPDKYITLTLTDPPYGLNQKYDVYDDTEENWYKLIAAILPEMIRVSKMVILPSCQIKRLKWIYDNFPPDWLICWYKGSVGHNSFIGFNDWEPHLVYGRAKNRLYMHDYFHTKSSPPKGTFNHPCPKPIEWATWIIERATNIGDLVCDPFIGSGTVAVASILLGRNFIGGDISEQYCQITNERIGEVRRKNFIPLEEL